MKPQDWQRLKLAVARACELGRGEREQALDEDLGSSGELREEAARILAALDLPGGPLGPSHTREANEERTSWQPPHRIGDLLLDRELGRGSMGTVFLARQESLARWVAVKILPPADALDEVAVARFVAEARKVARIEHSSIVTIHSVGYDAGLHYFVMELVEGHDLGREIEIQLAGAVSTGHLLPQFRSREYMPAVARLCEQVAIALAHAHEHDVVHRDVKPSNVLLDRRGHPFVVDFGIARDAREGEPARKGRVEGTPYYMSPEQVRIRGAHVDHRTDVYSLGIVLYELLTLQRPFEGRTTDEVLRKILDAEPRLVRRANPRVARDLEAICLKAIAKSPELRYSTASDLARDLGRFLGHESVEARPASGFRRGARIVMRRWKLAAAAALVLAAASIGGILVERRVEGAAADRVRNLATLGTEAARALAADPRASNATAWDRVEALRAELGRQVVGDTARGGDEALGVARAALNELARALSIESGAALERVRLSTSANRERDIADALMMLEQSRRLGSTVDGIGMPTTAEALLPRLSVRSIDPDASGTAFSRSISESGEPGARVLLGRLPIDSWRMPVGSHRIVVEMNDGTFFEFARDFEALGQDVVLDVPRSRPAAEVTRNMVRVPGGILLGSGGGDPSCSLALHDVEVAEFFLDASEVTNGQYKDFLADTRRAAPLLWRENAKLFEGAELDSLPVVDVSLEDSTAYCEWRGTRLPTHAEWELAARRALGSPAALPVADGVRTSAANVHGAPFALDATHADRFSRYSAFVRPASLTSTGAIASFEHLLGNVWELTGSPAFPSGGPRTNAVTSQRIVLGGGWDAVHQHGSLHAVAGPGEKGAFLMRGFRCAKGARP